MTSRDIKKCTNKACPIKEDCYRWIVKPSDHQAYTFFRFSREGEREYYCGHQISAANSEVWAGV